MAKITAPSTIFCPFTLQGVPAMGSAANTGGAMTTIEVAAKVKILIAAKSLLLMAFMFEQ